MRPPFHGDPRRSCAEAERHNMALSLITHDLKSPLVAIIGFCRVLAAKAADGELDAETEDLVRRMLRAGEGALDLAEDILAMAKLEAGGEKIEPVQVDDLEAEMAETLGVFEYEASSRRIKLAMNVVNELPGVFWDITRIKHHVLNNLMSNAMKFTPPGGTVTLEAESVDGRVLLKVIDTGSGVPENERERIFHRFEQMEMASNRVHKGAGLGLHNARLFARRHGGDIYIEDTPTGVGVAFVASLPYRTAASDL